MVFTEENSLSPNREEKILPPSQPLVSYSHRTREPSKSYAEAASPSNKPQLTAVPITVTQSSPIECAAISSPPSTTEEIEEGPQQIVLMDGSVIQTKIRENLPDYVPVERIPNRSYNNLDGSAFSAFVNKFYEESAKLTCFLYQQEIVGRNMSAF